MKGFQQFIREKKYLLNVSSASLKWYSESFKSLGIEDPSQEDLSQWVMKKREAGLSAVSVNTYARAINCYLKWNGSPLRVAKLKVPFKLPDTFSKSDIEKFMKWKPKTDPQSRLQCLILMLADCGLRINEALGLKWSDVEFDDLLLLVCGKGDKERRVPFSFELRRFLYKRRTLSMHDRVFCTRNGRKLSDRNVLRDVKLLCLKLEIHVPDRTVHAFRHSFAVNYLRKGGSVFHLQKALGHSDLEMSRKYANLLTEDLQKIHNQISLLS